MEHVIQIYITLLKELIKEYKWTVFVHPVCPVLDVTRFVYGIISATPHRMDLGRFNTQCLLCLPCPITIKVCHIHVVVSQRLVPSLKELLPNSGVSTLLVICHH